MKLLFILINNILLISKTNCFSKLISNTKRPGIKIKSSITEVKALSERQLQFWEDVTDGLERMEAEKKSNLKRIYEFGKSARDEIPAPEGIAPFHEPSTENIQGLTAKPYWDDISIFPWVKELEDNAESIKKELLSKLENDVFSSDSKYQSSIMGAGWSAFRLQRLGEWNYENCQSFPFTYELLQNLDIPFAVRGVCFARQLPNSGVAAHSDGRNFILTLHLGLSIPKGCSITVADETREWEEGKSIILDTSFTHSTNNPTDYDRHVLIIDFWHPELTADEREALEFLYDLRNKFETGQIPFRPPTNRFKMQNKGFFNFFG